MATKLPQDVDYGPRPSVEVNRLDRPGTGSQAVAAAAVIAANEFAGVLKANKDEQNSLNYSLARNEIQTADVQLQAELADDQDWATHDERYQARLRASADSISGTYDLDPRSRAMLDSEIKMITAKGRVSVGGAAKEREIKLGLASLNRGMADAREAFIKASDIQRPAIMRGQLQAINAAERSGHVDPDDAEIMRQDLTTDFSRATLNAMRRPDRIAEMEKSLGYRRVYGTTEFAEEIQDASDASGLSPNFIAAVGQQESGMDPNAISPTGNVGVMQLGELAAEDYGVTDRRHAGQSIMAGAQYLADLEERYDGDRAKALAAYNMGPGSLKEVIDKHGEDWMAAIGPGYYEETDKYVKALLPHWEGTAKNTGNMMTDQGTGIGPLTREEIMAGNGTGSAADFMHTDELAKMLEADYANDKENRDREAAVAVKDAAFKLFPKSHSERRKYIAQNSSGTVRNKAETEAEQHNNRDIAADRQAGRALFENYSDTIDEWAKTETPLTMNEIPEEHIAMMNAGEQNALKAAIDQASRDAQFARVTQQFDRGMEGAQSIEQWDALPDFTGDNAKVNQDLTGRDWREALDETDWNRLETQQQLLKQLEGAYVSIPNVKPNVDLALEAISYAGVTDTQEKNAIAARIETQLRDAVIREQASSTPMRALKDFEIDGLLNEIMLKKAFLPKSGLSALWSGAVEHRAATIETDKLGDAFMRITGAMDQPYFGQDPRGEGLTLYQYLETRSKDLRVDEKGASKEDIARAYYAYEMGMSGDEIDLRLKGGGK